jgi:hypothetical protein
MYMAKDMGEQAHTLQRLSDRTGMSTDAIQEWAYAVEAAGGSANSIKADLASLHSSMASVVPGELNMELVQLGISTRDASGELRSSGDVLDDLAHKMQGFTQQQAFGWGEKLGLSDDTIHLLRQGTEGIEALKKEAHGLGSIIPGGAIKAGAEFNKSMMALRATIKGMTQQISLAAMPTMRKMTEGFREWLQVNREAVASRLGGLAEGIANGFSRFGEIVSTVTNKIKGLLTPLPEFIDKMTLSETTSALVTGALVGLAVVLAIASAKFVAIGAAIVAVSAAIEDFVVWLQGGDSMIGRMVDTMTKWLDEFPELKAAFQSIGEVFSAVFGNMDKIVEGIKIAFEAMGAAVGGVLFTIMQTVNDLMGAFRTVGEGIGWLAAKLGFGGSKTSAMSPEQIKNAQEYFANQERFTQNEQVEQRTMQNSNSSVEVNNYIQTGASASEVGNAIRSTLPGSTFTNPNGFAAAAG